MQAIAEAFRIGGMWMYLILLLAFVTLPWLIAQTALNALEVRVPTIFWWVGSFSIAIVGAVGLAVGIGDVITALEHVSDEKRGEAAARGLALTFNVPVFAALVNMVAGGLVALGAGAANLFDAGEDAEYAGRGAAAVGGIAFVAFVAIGVLNVAVFQIGMKGLFPAASLLFGGAGCALARAVRIDADSPDRMATRRLTAIGGLLFSVVSSLFATAGLGYIEMNRTFEHVSDETRAGAIQVGYEATVEPLISFGGIGLVASLVIAGMLVATAGSHIVNQTVKRDAVACSVGLFFVAAAWGYVILQVQSVPSWVGDEVEVQSAAQVERVVARVQSPQNAEDDGER